MLRNKDFITFGGGGKLALGTTKDQNETSEFVYQFVLSEPLVKRKRTLEEDELSKKMKVMEESASNKTNKLLEELKEKEALVLEQAKKLEELQSAIDAKSKEMEEVLRREREEKESILTSQQASFHDQMSKMHIQFEEQKSKLLEEQNKLIQEADNQKSLALEEVKKKLEGELEIKEKQLKEISANALTKDDLQEEFTCSICQELILCAMTIECSHSFCSTCISDWLERKKQCRVCREPIVKSPVRSRSLDNAILKIVSRLGSKDKDEWEARVKQQAKTAEEEQTVRKLMELISTAKSRKLKFLNIYETWTNDERKVFLDGVGRYSGKPRALYCETTGLTKEFVQSASVINLRLAAVNLGLLILHPSLPPNTQELKDKLLKFIEGRS